MNGINRWVMDRPIYDRQEHLQDLRKQYRGRVEAMRGQVQQLTSRHEATKKELAASETVSERERARCSRIRRRSVAEFVAARDFF